MIHKVGDSDIFELLACPSCRGKLVRANEQSIVCIDCSSTYNIHNGVPHLLTETSKAHIERFWKPDSGKDQVQVHKAATSNVFLKLLRRIPEPFTPMFSVKRRVDAIYHTWELSLVQNKNPRILIVGTFLPEGRRKSSTFHFVEKVCEKVCENALRLDVSEKTDTDIIADGHLMPFQDDSFDVVVAQATMKHLRHPQGFVKEVDRVLKPGGLFYGEIAYLLAYHNWPGDYVRFTPLGIKELFLGFDIVETGSIRGPGFTVAEHLSIYGAALLSFNNSKLYSLFFKSLSWMLLPLKYLDPYMSKNKHAAKLDQVNYCIARKK